MDYNTVLPTNFIKNLKCSICDHYLSYFPIHISTKNEDICGRCQPPEGSTVLRNRVYEIVVQEILFPCRYVGKGCVEKLIPKLISKHEEQCPLRSVQCPASHLNLCPESLSSCDVIQHCEEKHSDVILKNGEFEINLLTKAVQRWNLIIEGTEVFIFKISYFPRTNAVCYSVCSCEDQPETRSKKCTLSVERSFASFVRSSHVGKNPQDQKIITLDLDNFKNGENDVVKCKLNIGDRCQNPIAEDKIGNSFFDLIKCSCCSTYIKPPVTVFFRDNTTRCASCAKADDFHKGNTPVVHTGFNKIAEKLIYKCPYTKNGCLYQSEPLLLKIHELHCLYQKRGCPLYCMSGCKWRDFGTNVISHILEKHYSLIAKSSSFSFSSVDDCPKSYIIKFSKYFFRVFMMSDSCKLFWFVDAMIHYDEIFKCEIEICNPESDFQKVIISELCQTLDVENTDKYHSLGLDQLEHLGVLHYIDNFDWCICFRVKILKL